MYHRNDRHLDSFLIFFQKAVTTCMSTIIMTPSVLHSKLETILSNLENGLVKSSQTCIIHVDVIRSDQNISLKKFCQADERKNYFSTTGFLTFFLPTEFLKFAYICSQLFLMVTENVKNILPSRSGQLDMHTWKIRKNSQLT